MFPTDMFSTKAGSSSPSQIPFYGLGVIVTLSEQVRSQVG